MPVLPDCCNPGVALRVVLLLLAGITIGALLVAEHLAAWSSLLVANLSLAAVTAGGALTSLCFLRPFVVGRSRVLQWSVGLGVPAAFMGLAGAVSIFLGAVTPHEPKLWIGLRMLASVAASFAILNHFQLRARAYSPSLSEARLIALQARIRPHFLFNSLNTVLGLLRSDPQQAESTLQDLAEFVPGLHARHPRARALIRRNRNLPPIPRDRNPAAQSPSSSPVGFG